MCRRHCKARVKYVRVLSRFFFHFCISVIHLIYNGFEFRRYSNTPYIGVLFSLFILAHCVALEKYIFVQKKIILHNLTFSISLNLTFQSDEPVDFYTSESAVSKNGHVFLIYCRQNSLFLLFVDVQFFFVVYCIHVHFFLKNHIFNVIRLLRRMSVNLSLRARVRK